MMTVPTQAQIDAENKPIIRRIEWKLIGFGIGVRPFWWQFGHLKIADTHWFNIGPFFVQWKVPIND